MYSSVFVERYWYLSIQVDFRFKMCLIQYPIHRKNHSVNYCLQWIINFRCTSKIAFPGTAVENFQVCGEAHVTVLEVESATHAFPRDLCGAL